MIVTLRHKRKDPWSGITKYKNCYDWIGPFLTRSGNAHTGLTSEDAARLEPLLNFTPGMLAPYSKYWDTFAVKITNNELILDTERPWDELQYLFLRNHKKVSNGMSDLKAGADYVLIDKEYEAEISNKQARIKREAIREFDKMSMEDMRKCLRIMGYKSDSMSNELIESKTFEIVEKDPSKFMTKWVNNKSKNTEFIIEAAIAKNIIRKSRNLYMYGTETIGSSLDDTISYLDNKSNQELKLAIMAELESK